MQLHPSPTVTNCQHSKKANCPLPGQCHTDQYSRVESVIYRAKIVREDTGKEEYYTGQTGGPMKERWYGHVTSIKNYNPDDGSYGKRMSRYVGELNIKGIPNNITWSIVARAQTYNPVTKSCRLCTLERYYIMYESSQATLNVKSEFFAGCPHKKKLLLKNYKKTKIKRNPG